MRHTGCRPGEACRLTRARIDVAADPWVYRPAKHMTRHKGKQRVITIGPRARAVLAEFPTAGPDDAVFSPRLAREERYAAMRAAGKTKVQPSQLYRRKERPERLPGSAYTTNAVAHAVTAACDKAGVARWHPNQLRHTFGSAVRKRFGLEAAQVLLGHERAGVTQVYAESYLALAATVAAEVG